MALLDPADSAERRPVPSSDEDVTKHPMICLAGGFGVIIAAALAVHFGLQFLL